jgi:hypothetical protein
MDITRCAALAFASLTLPALLQGIAVLPGLLYRCLGSE